MGWSLGGLSVISRCSASLAQDNYVSGIKFDASDRFCLDGQRLVAISGTYGQSGTEYRLQNDNTSRIVSYGQAGNGPAYFKVWTKAGQIMEYGIVEGGGIDSRIEAQGRSDALLWPVGRISDTVGNYITFKYLEDNSTGEHYITRIDYAGNSITGTSPYAYVEFNYEGRADITKGFVAGSNIKTSKRLRSIKTFSNNLQVKEYKLGYQYGNGTKYSRLVSLSECGADGKCKLSSNFTWSDSSNKFDDVKLVLCDGCSPGGLTYNTGMEHTGDFNGDGLDDYMYNYNGWYVALGKRDGTFEAPTLWLCQTCSPGGYTYNGDFEYIGDFNGDGKTDYMFNYNGWYVALSNGNTFDAPTLWLCNSCSPGGLTYNRGMQKFGDFNGDGRTDYMFNYNGWYVALSKGDAFETPKLWLCQTCSPGGYTYNGDFEYTGDFNGDGKTDYMFNYNGWYVALSKGDTFEAPTLWLCNSCSPGGLTYNRGKQMFGDFNSDGKTDYMFNYNGWHVALSKGDTFETPKLWLCQTCSPGGYTYNGDFEYTGDFNGDGKTDYMFNYNGWYVALSKGDTFEAPTLWLCNSCSPGGYTYNREHQMFGDYNGDGKTDYMFNSSGWHVAYGDTTTKRPDAITSITNGLGDQINITYEPLTNNAIYTKGSGSSYPIADVQAPIHVVTSYSMSDGLGGLYSYDYHYEDLKSHARGYGSLGFKKITMIDSQKGVKTITTYSQGLVYDTNNNLVLKPNGYPLIDQTQGKIRLLESRLTSGALLESTTASWESTSLSSGYDSNMRFIIHKASTVDETYKLSGSLVSRITTSYEFENQGTSLDYGNVSKVTILHNDNHTKVTTNSYNNIITSNLWLIGRLGSANVTNTTPYNEIATRTSSFEYDQVTGLLTKEIVEPGNPTHEKTTAYIYDAYGNKISVSISAPGVVTRTANTQYDSRGLFPINSTNALLQSESYEYDVRWGVRTKLTGPNSLSTSWQYDSLGRQVKEIRADGTYTTISYNLCDNGPSCLYNSPLWITKQSYGNNPAQPAGSVPSTIYFDPLGREVRTATLGFDGRVIEKLTEYNTFGQAYKVSQVHYVGDGYGKTQYEFDVLGRMTKEIKPDLSVTTVIYDGLKTTHINDKGQSKIEIKNSRGKIIQVVDAVGSVSTYGYDPFGNLVSTFDNAGNETRMTYDITGKKASMTDLDMGYWVYGYNALGELMCQRDANNARANDNNCLDDVNSGSGSFTSFMTYDKLGRMITRVEKEGTTSWVYDTAAYGKGKLHKSYSASNATTTHSYDSLGRPISISTVIDGKTFTSQIAYDPVYGRVQSKTYPSGFAISNVYNNLGFLIEIKNAADNSLYWRMVNMLANGKIVDENYGNGVTTLTSYNSLTERLEGILTGSGGSIQHLTYQFDTVGNMELRTDLNQSISESFEFDQLNRLVKSTMGTQVNTVSYDTIGNITYKTGVGSYTYSANSPHAVIIAGSTNYGYDYNGNMISGDGRTLTYTSFNKPLTISKGTVNNTYSYGADHNRIKKISLKNGTTTTTYYMGKTYEKTYKPTGVQEEKHYINAGGVTIVYTKRSNSTSNLEYLHKDHLGSTDVITDASGNIPSGSRSSFDAWGARRNTNWADTGNFGINIVSLTTRGFTGHEHDDEVGLINMNARMYDAKLGRFLSPDTFVQFPYSTQGMNRYTYVNNNPISYTDPSGHFVTALFAAIIKLAIKAIISRIISAVVAAIAGPNSRLAKALSTVISIYMGGGPLQSVATNYGGEKVQRFMQVMQFGQMMQSVASAANRVEASKVENTADKAIAGDAKNNLGGGKFKNGVGSGSYKAASNVDTSELRDDFDKSFEPYQVAGNGSTPPPSGSVVNKIVNSNGSINSQRQNSLGKVVGSLTVKKGVTLRTTGFRDQLLDLSEYAGGANIEVISGYRNQVAQQNLIVGGNPRAARLSQHTTGLAADIRISGLSAKQASITAYKSGIFNRVNLYTTSRAIHVDQGQGYSGYYAVDWVRQKP